MSCIAATCSSSLSVCIAVYVKAASQQTEEMLH